MNIDDALEKVREFHVAFNHPVAGEPRVLDLKRRDTRSAWLNEEVQEFIEAETVVDQADAMVDLIYFALGTLVEMGVKPGPLLDIVHQANMSKLWEDGRPRFGPDGKVKKPADWVDPRPALEGAVASQKSI